jgi:DNA gyrase subunit A
LSEHLQNGQGNGIPGNDPGEALPEIPLAARLLETPIEEELKDSYLTYAMSVIISRALPDVRDGLKPSQRRILVAMNDLGLTPGAPTAKCAAIVGETMKRYHPHGDQAIYPTLVRMGQEWNTRYPIIDKQGNFGSIAGLPPAAMRYTEARLSPVGALMLEDYKLDTVDFVPTYDEKGTEPTVLPSRFPNLLANGSQGIAVGMATSIPPHNLGEICDALVRLIDDPEVSIDELLEICPGPDFPTGGIICGRSGIRQGYHTGRGTITLRARTRIEETSAGRYRIVVSEIPYQQTRDRIEEEIARLVNEGRITGIANIRNESDLREPVRIVLELKRDAEPEVVLNQLYTYSPLQDSFSLIFLALVDGKPRILNFKELLQEYLRHRVNVIRRRTRYLLQKARQRKHTVEGLLIALANIDEVIRVIRTSQDQEEAKTRLMEIRCPAALLERALGPEGFRSFQGERGVAEEYSLTRVQAEAILRMTLAHLVNLEQQKLADEHGELLANIAEYLRLLSDERNILAVIRDDLLELKRKYSDERRTEISDEEIEGVDIESLIPEEQMVVSISSAGYIKRTSIKLYRAQRRGGKGLTGARTQLEDPIEHLFIANTHDYMLFFTNRGKVYWRKVYELPEMGRDGRGRAIVNLLHLSPGEKVTDCRAVRNFDEPGQYLMMATRQGLVKKTALSAFGRPVRSGIIAIRLRPNDELVDVVITKEADEVLLTTAHGWAIRFKESDVRPMSRAASGVRGISLRPGDYVVGMVVADPQGTLLTACEHGYGKRTPFGPNLEGEPEEALPEGEESEMAAEAPEGEEAEAPVGEFSDLSEADGQDDNEIAVGEDQEEAISPQFCYRTQRRGGKGIRDIKTSPRNGLVIGVTAVRDSDEVLMITARGKIQRIAAREIRVSGRNTQGVRIMSLEEGDTLVAVKRVPKEDEDTNGAG